MCLLAVCLSLEKYLFRSPTEKSKKLKWRGEHERLHNCKLLCLMRRVDSLEKTLMLGGIGGKRRKGRQRMRWLMASLTRWTWVWVNSGSWWWTGRPGMLRFMGSQRVGHDWATEMNWTELTRQTFVGKVMSLLLNVLSRLVITFLPRSKRLLISWLQSSSAVILKPPKNNVWYFSHSQRYVVVQW